MSTGACIAIKEGKKYISIYNHSDSYIRGLGLTLYKYYNNIEMVKKLIALGNTYSIGNTIQNTAETFKEHINRSPEQRGTVAEFRESRRWKDYYWPKMEKEMYKESDNICDIFAGDFIYVYDTDNNKWYVGHDYEEYKLRELEEVLRLNVSL